MTLRYTQLFECYKTILVQEMEKLMFWERTKMDIARSRKAYVHNVARTLAGQNKIESSSFSSCWPSRTRLIKELIRDGVDDVVMRFVGTLSDAKKGEIACCGISLSSFLLAHNNNGSSDNIVQVSLFDAAQGDMSLRVTESGDSLVSSIAMLAIIAAIADNIMADITKARPKPDALDPANELTRPIVYLEGREQL